MRTVIVHRAARAAVVVLSGILVASASALSAVAAAIDVLDLQNGMKVVVVKDHRAPVVTHMVWYRVGGADDPAGKGGLAHFLEHLMFKATAARQSGEFTRVLTRLGARHNALTNHDTTSYFQRIAKQHLRRVMELEADRMVNLRFDATEVTTERDVVREERRSSVDASPIGKLNEQIMAQLYQNHPYGRPVLGWAHEIAGLELTDAAAFYRRHYAPNNAVLVVAGDVETDAVRALAEQTYGRIAANPDVVARTRPREPEHNSPRTLTLEDAQAGGSPILLRSYHIPIDATDARADIAALRLLARVLGGDDTSRLYRRLVLDEKVAVQAGADYQGSGRDSHRFSLLAIASGEATRPVELEIDRIVSGLASAEVGEDELERAKRALEAEAIYERDNVEAFARRIGEAVTSGRSIADIEKAEASHENVTVADIRRVAGTYLRSERSVTGVVRRPAPAVSASTSTTDARGTR